jgi:hypothetical protein
MSDTASTTINRTWVAHGPAGVVGSIHRTPDGFSIRVGRAEEYHGDFPTLDVAKSALHAALGPGSDRPEFSEH